MKHVQQLAMAALHIGFLLRTFCLDLDLDVHLEASRDASCTLDVGRSLLVSSSRAFDIVYPIRSALSWFQVRA